MKKRYSVVAFIIVLLFSVCNLTACGEVSNTVDNGVSGEKYADTLNGLGLFLGTDNGYDLEKAVTRVQAAAMLVRFLGAESAAQNGNDTHPFVDVPDWADKYVAYMYNNGLTQGMSATSYGSDSLCGLQMYATFLLRALKYDEGIDFTFNTAVSKVRELGITKKISEGGNFARGDMVTVSYFALSVKIKGSENTLLDKLVMDGAVSEDAAKPIQDLFTGQSGTNNNSATAEPKQNENKGEENSMKNISITVGDKVFTATMNDNAAARAFAQLMPMTINMSDYGGFEKVGSFGTTLPTNDVSITTKPGDFVLYQGNSIVLFYGSNTWSYTRLGRIDDITGLAEALGTGNVEVTFDIQ